MVLAFGLGFARHVQDRIRKRLVRRHHAITGRLSSTAARSSIAGRLRGMARVPGQVLSGQFAACAAGLLCILEASAAPSALTPPWIDPDESILILESPRSISIGITAGCRLTSIYFIA